MADFRTDLSEANSYIQNFIERFPEVASDNALGGNLTKSALNGVLQPNKVGSMSWFCWNPESLGGFPVFFLAYEALSSYSKTEPQSQPESETLISPGNSFVYEDQPANEYLENHQSNVSGLENGSIGKDQVVDFKENFSSQFQVNSAIPYSFFDRKESFDLEDFIQQADMEYIGYFFGYSDDPAYGDNKIRIILGPLGSDGRVLMGEGAVYLQRSFPPPPDS